MSTDHTAAAAAAEARVAEAIRAHVQTLIASLVQVATQHGRAIAAGHITNEPQLVQDASAELTAYVLPALLEANARETAAAVRRVKAAKAGTASAARRAQRAGRGEIE